MTATADSQLIQNVVSEVLKRLGPGASLHTGGAAASGGRSSGSGAETGRFANVDDAVAVAVKAQRQVVAAGLETRDRICTLLKKIAGDNKDAWGRFELDETKLGRLDHKIAKLELLAKVPGVEFLRAHATTAHSGSNGVALDEAAPWGVIGCITPVTHSIPTMTANAINMIAAGNSLVVNAHPSGAKSAAMAAEVYNRAIKREFGIDPLICIIDPPTLESAEAIFSHKDIPLLCITGGPAVARAAMKQQKRAVVGGPGNPPVVVDHTADFDHAARSILAGAAFDNNLLCIGEKEVFVVAVAFDRMMKAMERAGAMKLSADQIKRLQDVCFKWEKDHFALNKDAVGRDPQVLGKMAGFDVPRGVELLFGETDEKSPFVPEEQMTPFVPFVKTHDFDEALELALKHEHGFGHTALIHSQNLDNITRMGRAMNTTIFVANGPSTAGLGAGGEGYASYTVATPTGEGITNPATFTRFRRFGVSGSLRIV